jgi:hypothetical protein
VISPLDRPSIQPFPITNGRYEVLPGMRLFGKAGFGMPAETGHFRLDQTTPDYLRNKLSLRQSHPDSALQLDAQGDDPQIAEAVWQTLAVAAQEEPAWITALDEGFDLPMLGIKARRTRIGVALETNSTAALSTLGQGIASQVRQHQPTAGLVEFLGLVLPCDMALVHAAPDDDPIGDRSEFLHVSFPSSWTPRLKVGRDFATIHRPVANHGVIMKGHVNLVRAMCFKGPYVRYAWGLHRHGELDSNPDHGREKPDVSSLSAADVAAQTWLRVERQTTLPLPALRRGLFTIRTYVEALEKVAKDAAKAAQLASAIRSMDDESLRYKGLPDRRDALLEYLDDAST